MKFTYLISAWMICVALTGAERAWANETVIAGVGTMSCGKFLEYRASRDQTVDLALRSWLQGLLSGMNVQLIANKRQARLLPDSDTIMAYVDKHCRDNPLSDPFSGGMKLHREMKPAPG